MTMIDEAAEEVREQLRMTHGRMNGLAWQLVHGGASASGKRLLVIELDIAAEGRVLAALEVLAGRSADWSTGAIPTSWPPSGRRATSPGWSR